MIRVLKDEPYLPRQSRHANLSSILPVNQDPPPRWLQQPVQMLGESSLSGPVLAHYRDEITTLEVQVDILQGSLARAIGEVNFLERNHWFVMASSVEATVSA